MLITAYVTKNHQSRKMWEKFSLLKNEEGEEDQQRFLLHQKVMLKVMKALLKVFKV